MIRRFYVYLGRSPRACLALLAIFWVIIGVIEANTYPFG